MDKLELDARVARLERRVGILMTAMVLAAACGVCLVYFARVGHEEVATVAMAAPLPSPTPMPEWIASTPAPEAIIGGFGMAHAEGAMGALFHDLSTMDQLRDEGIISEEEWRAKKAVVLEQPLNPGELRSDLQLVQQLLDTGAICEEDRAALRAKLLGIEDLQEF